MKTLNLYIFLVIFLAVGLPSHAQKSWKVNGYAVDFKIKNAGFWVDGSFKGLKADISFDPSNLKGSISATIDASTIDTGIDSRDKHLRKEEYFDVEKYPTINMKTSRFARSKSGNYIGYFTLTIKGKSQNVTVPFEFDGKTFKGYFTINRRDFGVGKNSLIMKDDVKLEIKVDVEAM